MKLRSIANARHGATRLIVSEGSAGRDGKAGLAQSDGSAKAMVVEHPSCVDFLAFPKRDLLAVLDFRFSLKLPV